MFSIKDSFADCSKCSLSDAPSCILETNSKSDLSKVDVVFVSENPGKNEVEKQVPLIGKAGQTFRKYFNKYIKKECKWLLTNCVLCLTLDEKGNTGNPEDEVIDRCKENCFRIIEACNPKLIVLMGTSPMKAFGLGKSGITNLRGKMFNWKGCQVLLTVHPSYVNRNRTFEEKFERDIISAANIVAFLDKPIQIDVDASEAQKGEKGIYRYKIPEKFYTDDFRLVDIQYLNKTNEVLYIFRDRDNKKVYHKECDDYIAYVTPEGLPPRKIIPYDQLHQIKVSFKEKIKLDFETTYEGDLRITVKHAMDYYHFNKAEADKINSNIMFADIEIDTGIDNKSFPQPKDALYPINMISTIYHKKVTCYVIDNNTDPIKEQEGAEIKIFKNERKMFTTFIADFKEIDPDFISGWNAISFDLEYIFNRLPRIKISRESFSKFGEFYVDGFRYICNLPGCVVLDQLYLYKSFTFTKKENYKLGTIGEIEVKETKVKMEFPINEMYYKDINKLIEYNIRDSVLLDKLEDKLGHINLLNELRIICNSSFDGASSPFGQVDSIIVSFLREKGLASKNSNPHVPKKDYPGAFVLEPTPGVYDYAADLDYTSLYPSLIMTYNIGVNNFVMRTEDPAVGHDIAYNPDSMSEEIIIIDDPTFEKKRIYMKKEDILKKIKNENLIHTINGCFFKNHSDELSVYSQVLESLLRSRRAYKKKMLDAKEAGDKTLEDFYNTKQMVYKVLANSLYGVIANKAFRFFDINCAAAITLGGQETLKTSIIEGDAYMNFLKGDSKDPLEGVTDVTRREVYDRIMPDRKPKNIITGDTDSIFICFEKFKGKKSDDMIIGWCNKLQDYLNSISIQKTIARHNVSSEYNKLELKNELVIKRGLFLAKKYYSLHVTNQEGRTVDEVVYMGIAVKRSDTPSHTKVFLKELLDIILKSESFGLPLLFKFINQKEKEFMKLIKEGSKTIAKPVGWNKPIKEYKSLPEGVRGMINFNEVSYPIHSIGNRGYLFHVNGIDLDKAPPDIIDNYNKNILEKGKKLDIIVLPDEEEVLPDYYVPNIKTMLAKSFKERYELILKPLTEAKKKEEIMTI